MPKLGQLVEPTKPLVVTFGGVDLTLEYRPSAVTPRFQKAVAAAQRDGDVDALILEPLCRLIAAWYSPSRSPKVGSGVFASRALMPILAMKSMPREVPLTSGCQMATGRWSG